MEAEQALNILIAMQAAFALFAGGVGFLCGYMFCYESYFTKEKPDRKSDRAHKSLE